MLADLLKVLPEDNSYVEVFSGSAKLLLNKPPSKWELLNDANQDIINFFRVVKHRLAELVEAIDSDIVHPERFKELRSTTSPDEIDRAHRFCYLALYSFGGRQQHFAGGFLDKNVRAIDQVRSVLQKVSDRLRNVKLECRDCLECVKRYDRKDTLFFLDPPYLGESARLGTYGEMDIDHHHGLAAALSKVKGKFLLTYNDSPEVRDLYPSSKQCFVLPIKRIYTLAGNGSREGGEQLIIANFNFVENGAFA